MTTTGTHRRPARRRKNRRCRATRPVPAVIQRAPDRQGTAILVAFGALVTLWLLSGPIDGVMMAESMLLPPLVGYEIGNQAAAAEGR